MPPSTIRAMSCRNRSHSVVRVPRLHNSPPPGESPSVHLANYKVPTVVADVLSEEEIRRVLKACDLKTDWGERAHAILTLMLDAGLRISEVTGLKTADLNLEGGWLKVMGKGSKERIIPFGAAAQRALWRYAHHYRPTPLGPDVYFFLTLDGRPLGTSGLTSTIKRVAERSEVTRLHPHRCRHTFATALPHQRR